MRMENVALQSQIAKRLCKMVKGLKVIDVMITLDKLTGVELDLHGLLFSSDFDFMHDMSGIFNFMDRETGKLKNCFLPRYARKTKPADEPK